jgi:hypothetical protein
MFLPIVGRPINVFLHAEKMEQELLQLQQPQIKRLLLQLQMNGVWEPLVQIVIQLIWMRLSVSRS